MITDERRAILLEHPELLTRDEALSLLEVRYEALGCVTYSEASTLSNDRWVTVSCEKESPVDLYDIVYVMKG